jgi:hypothetical protein
MIEIMINAKASFCPQKQLTHFTLFGLLTISHKKQTGTEKMTTYQNKVRKSTWMAWVLLSAGLIVTIYASINSSPGIVCRESTARWVKPSFMSLAIAIRKLCIDCIESTDYYEYDEFLSLIAELTEDENQIHEFKNLHRTESFRFAGLRRR